MEIRTVSKTITNPHDYKYVAKQLGVKYLFGRWGVSFYSQMPEGDKHWRIRFIPLDHWNLGVTEVYHKMKKRDFDL